MQSLETVQALRERLQAYRLAGERIAFVPTMGNLHAGHLQLVKRARESADRLVVSVFVNPLQFAPGEDYETYPRTPRDDAGQLQRARTDVLFLPRVEEIYPLGTGATTRVQVPGVGQGLEEDFRPGFFSGVASVVARLFNLVQPDVAVFGEKDYQQLAVIRTMVRDLCWPIKILGEATVRETDGLAMSSRNRYLTPGERAVAPQLNRVLESTAETWRSIQGANAVALEQRAIEQLREAGFRPDYVSIRHAESLEPGIDRDDPAVVLAAAWLGRARLIDNRRV